MKYNVKITKNFTNALWKISDKGILNPTIQELRIFGYIFEHWNDEYKIEISIKDLYKNVFKYKDRFGIQRKLISNINEFKSILNIFYKKYNQILNMSVSDNILTFEFNTEYFFINGLKKSQWKKELMKKKGVKNEKELVHIPIYAEEAYVNYPYKKVNNKLWDTIRLRKGILDWKMFFFILSEMMRGQFKTIKIDILDLMDRLMILDKNKRRVKSKFRDSLEFLKSIKFISDYVFVKDELRIEKYNKK